MQAPTAQAKIPMAFSHIRERIGTDVAGQYHLLRMIGEGGMGAVFEAEHRPSQQRVAVKLIKPEYASQPEVNGRFVQEVNTVARIGHPNIVQMLDAGTDEEGPYLVLELLEGETLCDLIDRRPLGFREALSVVAETLDALRAAHGVGVVHRDIKPENIFLVGGERWKGVKLLDFGIAKILTEQSLGGGLTRVGTAVGTPDYMSPEQAGGGRVDPRADLWSLAAVLYECVSQTTPFDGDSYQQLISRIVVHPHTPLVERVPAAPPGLCALIDKALQKEPAQRFASAEVMLDEVRRLLDVLPSDDSLGPRDDPTSIFVPSPEALRYDMPSARPRPVPEPAPHVPTRSLPPVQGPSLRPPGPPPPPPSLRPQVAPVRSSPLPPPPSPMTSPWISAPPSGPPPPPPRFAAPVAHSLMPMQSAEATQLNAPPAPPESYAPSPSVPGGHLPAPVFADPGFAAVGPVTAPAPPDRRRLVVAVAAAVTALLLVAALFFPSPTRTASSPVSLPTALADDGGSVSTVVINPGVAPETAPTAQAPPGDPMVQQVLAPTAPPEVPPPRPTPTAPSQQAPGPTPTHRDPLTAPRVPLLRARPVRVAAPDPERAGQPWTPSEIFQVMRPHTPDLRACFAGAPGNLQMLFDVDERGRMESPRIVSMSPGDARWRCVLGVVRRVHFGAGRPGRALTFFQSYSN